MMMVVSVRIKPLGLSAAFYHTDKSYVRKGQHRPVDRIKKYVREDLSHFFKNGVCRGVVF